jgi:hypothetical protein
MGFCKSPRERVITLFTSRENQKMLSGRISNVCARSSGAESEFCAKNGGHLMHGGCFGKTHSTVQSVMIGNGYSAQTQTASGFHQFFRR